jgi:hypothetical protein
MKTKEDETQCCGECANFIDDVEDCLLWWNQEYRVDKSTPACDKFTPRKEREG